MLARLNNSLKIDEKAIGARKTLGFTQKTIFIYRASFELERNLPLLDL